MDTTKRYVVYELKKDGRVIDYGWVTRDLVQRNGELNTILKGDGLELRILPPTEGMEEIQAKEIWSELKSKLNQ
ncbi:MAG: hypothetical protein AABX49_00650 [Nanoarchaeota archaeon]